MKATSFILTCLQCIRDQIAPRELQGKQPFTKLGTCENVPVQEEGEMDERRTD